MDTSWVTLASLRSFMQSERTLLLGSDMAIWFCRKYWSSLSLRRWICGLNVAATLVTPSSRSSSIRSLLRSISRVLVPNSGLSLYPTKVNSPGCSYHTLPLVCATGSCLVLSGLQLTIVAVSPTVRRAFCRAFSISSDRTFLGGGCALALSLHSASSLLRSHGCTTASCAFSYSLIPFSLWSRFSFLLRCSSAVRVSAIVSSLS
mmetsp:Transcript_15805/g.39784  ORF Transcript_15805/g.39784 Transcript_15805/m.39784 type:complete len:204 (-) Transcript_15805:375-986(-)